MNEDKYEALELIVKCRADGESWFNIVSDYITQDCEGGGGDCLVEDGDASDCDDHEHDDIIPCTCGMESMGGMSGTLDQCYAWTTTVGSKLQPIDLARVIVGLAEGRNVTSPVMDWAKREVEFEDNWNTALPEDVGEDFRELTIDQEEG